MALDGRIERLERALGVGDGDDDGPCKCPTMNRDIRSYMGEGNSVADARNDTRPAEVCGRCRRPKRIIQFVGCSTREDVADVGEESWR